MRCYVPLVPGETVTGSSTPPVSVSVVIPCLDEAETIEQCVRSASRVLLESGIDGEVIVVDNGSSDGSADLARAAGAVVVEERRRGYGSAYLAGFARASGNYLVMIDADLTYDFAEIPRFVAALDAGAGLVMGNRMSGLNPGAMGLVSRIGNPLLSGFLNLLYRTPVRDAHCGMRAVQSDVLDTLGLRSSGHGVCVGDGDPSRATRRHDHGDPDPAAPAERRVEALAAPGRLAAPEADARLSPDVPLSRAWTRDVRHRCADHGAVSSRTSRFLDTSCSSIR